MFNHCKLFEKTYNLAKLQIQLRVAGHGVTCLGTLPLKKLRQEDHNFPGQVSLSYNEALAQKEKSKKEKEKP